MSVYQFGSGTAIGRRTDISNPTPGFFGVLQDIEIDFDQTLKELKGGYKVAVDVASADFKITGKIKSARIQGNQMNDMFFGQQIATASGQQMTINEAATIPATPYQVTVAGSATFKEDMGVFYASTFIQLKRVASGPIVGQYSVNEATGVYTFAAADTTVAVLIFYTKTVTTQSQITLTNQLMGSGSSFELNLQNTYTNDAGVVGNFYLKLNACKSSKLALPFKNTEHLISGLDFQAYADPAGNIGLIATSE